MKSLGLQAMLVLLLSLTLWSGAGHANASDVLVVCSHDCARYSATTTAFSDYLGALDIDPQLYQKALTAATLRSDAFPGTPSPQLIFAVDYPAAAQLATQSSDIPMLVGMAARENDIRRLPNATGVVLGYPVKTQLEWMRNIAPAARRIGVLYSSPENQQLVEAARQLAPQLGLEIVAHAVREPKDLPNALKQVLREADMLWGIPDATIFSPQTAKAVLLAAFRKRIPLIGMSSSWVKAGALYSLEWDASDIGTQSGQMAEQLLSGKTTEQIAPQSPRQVNYTLNLKTARHCKLEVPDKMIKEASYVFK